MSFMQPTAQPPQLFQNDPSAAAPQQPPTVPTNNRVECANQPTFTQCMGNYQADGGIASCNGLPKASEPLNQCLCKQYFVQTYCYNVFCPQDPLVPQLRNLQSQYCALVPNFTPNPTGSVVMANPLPGGVGAETTTVLLELPKHYSRAHKLGMPGVLLTAVIILFIGRV